MNRINNYNILNSKLKLKIVVNGNPFYYGRLMVDYVPLRGLDAVTSFSVTASSAIVGASQRLHGFIDPTQSTGLMMELPYIWPENGSSIPLADFSLLGDINIRELAPLKHANGSVTPLTINIFAWAEDLKLSIPTTRNCSLLVAQASEVDMKPSSILSAVASASGLLSKVPVIGPYALATSMVAGALGKVARLFGFSRPAIITPPMAMRATNVGELSVVDKKENLQRLVADSRQELTIDSSVIGVKLPDELTINYIAGKESWIYSIPWTVARVEGDHLFSARVNPAVCVVSGSNYYLPACAFAAMPFAYWRGTMKYRFQVVCSQYHKGRLMFVFDPYIVGGLEPNVQYNRIVDLEREKDFTIDVAWASPAAFLPVGPPGSGLVSTSPFVTTNANSNGVLAVYVLNELSTPNSTVNNDITIQVYVSACDDFDLAQPTSAQIGTMAYVTQSSEIDIQNQPTSMEADECMAACLPEDNTHLVFFGEKFISFRSLLKRYNFHSSFFSGFPAAARYYWTVNTTDFPPARGLTGSGGTNNGGLANYSVTTLLNYLAPAFLASRGSIRYKRIMHLDSPNDNQLFVSRGQSVNFSNTTLLRDTTSNDLYSKQAVDATIQKTSLNGAAITTHTTQPCLEYEVPYYRPYRFSIAKDPYRRAIIPTYSLLDSGHATTGCVTLTPTSCGTMDSFVSVGEDFQLLLFQGAPAMYYYNIP